MRSNTCDNRPPRLLSFLAIAIAAAVAFCALPRLATAQDAPSSELAATSPTNLASVVSYSQPPSDFDPLAASDAALAHYGFPPRPDPQSAPAAYASWKKLVSSPQTRITNPSLEPTKTYYRPAENLSSRGEMTVDGAASYSSSNWSGYTVSTANGTFNVNNAAVYAEYIVPIAQTAFGVCSGSWNYSAQWIGFDGFGSGDVLQAGTEANANCAGNSKQTSYFALYEWYPNGPVKITNFKVQPGNVMGLEVWYTTASPSGHLYFINYTTQKSVTIGFDPPPGTGFTGNSVEWVVERPGLGSGYTTLAHYVASPFNNTYALVNGAYYYPGSSPAGTIYNITMVSGTTPISVVNLYGNSTLWFYDEEAPK